MRSRAPAGKKANHSSASRTTSRAATSPTAARAASGPVRTHQWVDLATGRTLPAPSMSGMPDLISRDDVVHVARLARLALTDEELDTYTGQLAGILEHAADVAALDTAGVPPTAHPLPLENVLRDDEVRPSLDR